MREKLGLILLDGEEVIIRIYVLESPTTCLPAGRNWKLAGHLSYDLATFQKRKLITSSEIIEIIADVSLSQTALHVSEWKILTRNLSESTARDVTSATGISTEILTLTREQELLCKGVLAEM